MLIFLFLLDTLLNMAVNAIEIFINKSNPSYSQSNLFPTNDFIIMTIEMIFLVCISICLLKYKYYKHHFISIIIFLFFGIICEIILDDYKDINGTFILIKFIRILQAGSNAAYFCYQKYMMEKLFYPYWNIAFVPGVIIFIFASIVLIVALSDSEREYSSLPVIPDFYLYYKQISVGFIIGKILFDFILHVIMCSLDII